MKFKFGPYLYDIDISEDIGTGDIGSGNISMDGIKKWTMSDLNDNCRDTGSLN